MLGSSVGSSNDRSPPTAGLQTGVQDAALVRRVLGRRRRTRRKWCMLVCSCWLRGSSAELAFAHVPRDDVDIFYILGQKIPSDVLPSATPKRCAAYPRHPCKQKDALPCRTAERGTPNCLKVHKQLAMHRSSLLPPPRASTSILTWLQKG